MKTVTIIDAMCGAGKTSWAIQEINKNPEGPWLFITPYLDEVGRILEACSGFHEFSEPSAKGQSKSQSLRDLVTESKNIVSTHALFKQIDDDTINDIENAGYRLIIDEVPPVLDKINVPNKEVATLFNVNVLKRGEQITEKIVKVKQGETELGRYEELRRTAKRDQLVLVDDVLFFWVFPARAFEAFKDITVMTYLYPGSILSCYFRCYGFEVDRMSVTGEYGVYQVVPHDSELERDRRTKVKALVTIYEMPNDKLFDKTALSYSWYSGKKPVLFKRLQADHYNYHKNRMKAKADEVMWTAFKDCNTTNKKVQPNGYAKCFVPCNLRASNGYRKKTVLAYLVNRYLNPTYKSFFRGFGIDMNEGLYALGDFIQWFFRSAIRDGKPVTIWIPSGRMRGLFERWLDCEI